MLKDQLKYIHNSELNICFNLVFVNNINKIFELMSEVLNNKDPEVLATSRIQTNMATTDFFIQQLAPAKLRKGDDIERFIQKCEEFFKVSHYSPSDAEILIKCFMEEDMLQIYSRIDLQIKGYAAKLRKAFTKETNLLEEMRTALSFKQKKEDPQEFFEKVEKFADKIFTAKLTRETFIELLLIEASKEEDLQKQLIMSNTVGVEGIKEKIEKLHLVQLKTESEVLTIRTTPQGNRNYAEATKRQGYIQKPYSSRETTPRFNANNGNAGRNENYERYPRGHEGDRGDRLQQGEYTRRTITCWTCQADGHLSRDCPKRVITCFACNKQGHVRRNCPTIRCRRCQNNGHEEAQCFTNLERKRLGYTYENRRQNENSWRYQNLYNDINRKGYQNGNRQIAYVNQDREDQGGISRDGENGYNINIHDDVQGDEHPNEYASSEGGLIGAIY